MHILLSALMAPEQVCDPWQILFCRHTQERKASWDIEREVAEDVAVLDAIWQLGRQQVLIQLDIHRRPLFEMFSWHHYNPRHCISNWYFCSQPRNSRYDGWDIPKRLFRPLWKPSATFIVRGPKCSDPRGWPGSIPVAMLPRSMQPGHELSHPSAGRRTAAIQPWPHQRHCKRWQCCHRQQLANPTMNETRLVLVMALNLLVERVGRWLVAGERNSLSLCSSGRLGQRHNNPLNPRCFCLQRPKRDGTSS